MSLFSARWLAAVRCPRERKWSLPFGSDEPLMPWITPAVPPELAALFAEEGQLRELAPGEYVYTPKMPLSLSSLIVEGVAGRAFGSLYNQSKESMAVAIPGRICGGNHTFFSTRPGNGRYFAVTPLKVLTLPNSRIREKMREDENLRSRVEVQLECCIQSDRIGLGAVSVLAVGDRLRLSFLSWGFAYGRLETINGVEWLTFDAVLPQTQLARLVAASLIQIKRSVAELKAAGILVTEDGLVRVRSASLDGVWQWLCSCEEPVSDFARPRDWRPYVTDN